MANVIKLFWRNYVAIGVTSVKVIEKYADSGINYALKSFIILGTVTVCTGPIHCYQRWVPLVTYLLFLTENW